uniref:Uncharacterized protein n=1 Tax=Lepeophtheirus salmonis TaxID=72036 RepID=A0A0K2V2F5_LEPSM
MAKQHILTASMKATISVSSMT